MYVMGFQLGGDGSVGERAPVGQALPGGVPKPTVWRQTDWGETLEDMTLAGTPHVNLRITCVPEGYLTVVRCAHCGARMESLLDRRDRSLRPQALVEMTARACEWGSAHATCPAGRMRPLPEALDAVCDVLIAETRSTLAVGGHVPGRAWALTEDGRSAMFLTDALALVDDEPALRRIAIASKHFDLREDVRSTRSTVAAAVHIAVFSVKPGAPASVLRHLGGCREVLRVATVTPSVGVAKFLPIDRIQGHGGVLLDGIVTPLGVEPLLEGLVVTLGPPFSR